MKKLFIIFIIFFICASNSYPGINVGGGRSTITPDPTDVTKAERASEIDGNKTSGVPGYNYLFEAETTNELFSGFQGPDDLSVNIRLRVRHKWHCFLCKIYC